MRHLIPITGALVLALLCACAPPAAPTPSPSPATPVETPAPPDTLRLTRESFPALDGSTSTAPLARAVCAVLLGEDLEQVSDLVSFSKTTASYRSLMAGQAELLIAAEPARSVVEEKEAAGFQWEMAPIATDALVFLVNEDNPVDRLTAGQIRKIYTGEITNWSQVGGEDRAILPFQRNPEAGSQTLMQKLVMGDLPLMEAPKDYVVSSMEGLIEAVRSFDGSPGAIGYTVYYYANDMNMADGLKVVAVDGAAPDAGTIRSGAYPFTNPYYAVIAAAAPERSPARQVFDWLQGPVGQSLIAHEGYVSILGQPAQVDWDLGETAPIREVYTRLDPGPLPALIPAEGGYGPLLPYVGSTLPGEWWDRERYGLVTREGEIVVDPVYDSVWRLGGFLENDFTRRVRLPVYALSRTLPAGDGGEYELRYALCAVDGSWATGFDYRSVTFVDEGHIWAVAAGGDGAMLDPAGRELWRLPLPQGADPWYYQGESIFWSSGVGSLWNGEDTDLIRLDGSVVHGAGQGWDSAQGFREGRSAAHDAGKSHGVENAWGYIDREGDWAVPPIYQEAREFEGGVAVVYLADGAVRAIDPDGGVLWESDRGYLSRAAGDGFSYYYHWDQGEGGSHGSILACYNQDFQEIDFGITGKPVGTILNGWMAEPEEGGVRLTSPLGVRHIPFRGEARGVEGGLVFLQADPSPDGETATRAAYTLEGEEVLTLEEVGYLYLLTDEVTGEHFLYAETGGRYDLYDLEGNFLVSTSGYPTLSGGLLSCRTDLSYGYQTLEGEWVFRISLMKSMGD